MKICVLDNVQKRYDKNKPFVLNNVNLTVNSGDIVGIKGYNGAGKSTLLSIIAKCEKYDAGKISYADTVEDKIAYVMQDISLYDDLTGMENLKFWGLALGMPGEQIKIRSRYLIKRVGLLDKADEPLSSYSGGMKRRLHLASALMQTPKLLLLDEATVGADDFSAEIITDIIKELAQKGCGIVMSSHLLGELDRVCTRIVTLDNGILR